MTENVDSKYWSNTIFLFSPPSEDGRTHENRTEGSGGRGTGAGDGWGRKENGGAEMEEGGAGGEGEGGGAEMGGGGAGGEGEGRGWGDRVR